MRTIIWRLKKLERNVKRQDVMKFLLWFIEIVLFAFVTFISKAYSNEFSWWLWIIFVLMFYAGNFLIYRKMDHLNKQFFLIKFPILDELKFGQLITIELENGKVLANRVFIITSSNEIKVGSEQVLNNDPEEMLKGFKKNRWINLKKVKAIKVESV